MYLITPLVLFSVDFCIEPENIIFYGPNNIIFCLIMEFYFLPINLFKYYKKKRAQHIYNKLLITIQVLKEELGTINNNQKWR